MKIKTLTFCSNQAIEGAQRSFESTTRLGFDREIVPLVNFNKWGCLVDDVEPWCRLNRDKYTHVLYQDAWDTLALGSFDELVSKIPPGIKFFGSTEKACFPDPELAAQYPPSDSKWRYVNGGLWLAEIDYWLQLCEEVPMNGKIDQLWLAERYIEKKALGDPVALDTYCDIFQSIAFEDKEDFAVTRDGRVYNRKTGSLPVIIHGNGKTDMQWIYDIKK